MQTTTTRHRDPWARGQGPRETPHPRGRAWDLARPAELELALVLLLLHLRLSVARGSKLRETASFRSVRE